jgi:hypothetical protein
MRQIDTKKLVLIETKVLMFRETDLPLDNDDTKYQSYGYSELEYGQQVSEIVIPSGHNHFPA